MPTRKHECLLTRRQKDVMELLVRGLTNKAIGYALRLSPDTVRKHTMDIYARLYVDNRVSATVVWMTLKGDEAKR